MVYQNNIDRAQIDCRAAFSPNKASLHQQSPLQSYFGKLLSGVKSAPI